MKNTEYASKQNTGYEAKISLISDYIENPIALDSKKESSEIYGASCGGGCYGCGGCSGCGGCRVTPEMLESKILKN